MKGKHGAAAAVRHEVQSAAQQIETYKHAVARLTAELKAEKDARRAEQHSRARTERELRARLDQAASPKIDALELLLAKERAKVSELSEISMTVLAERNSLSQKIMKWLMEEQGWTHADAVRFAGEGIGLTVLGEKQYKIVNEAGGDEEHFESAGKFDRAAEKKAERIRRRRRGVYGRVAS